MSELDSRVETLLGDMIAGDSPDIVPRSRVEQILVDLINSGSSDVKARSRVETLLKELEVGGGGVTILSGTSEPSAGLGENGQVYLRTMDAPSLPSGYTAVDYVQSNGYACFDTGYSHNSATKVAMKFLILSYPSSYPHIFTEWSGSAPKSFYFCPKHRDLGQGAVYIFSCNEQVSGKSALMLNTMFSIVCDINGSTWYNESGSVVDSISVTGGTGTSSTTLKLMGGGASDNYTDMRMYSCQIYEGDTLIHDYVPCKNSNNVVGVYDIVVEAFLQNASSGSMIAGPDLDPDAITFAYAKVSGIWQPLIGTDINDIILGN